MRIDLQLHSTYSDGYLTPSEIAKFVAKNGIKAAALTDHNTISGINEFQIACKKNKVKAIVGLELYAKLNGNKFNILWFNFDYTHPDLHALLRESQIRRRKKARSILFKIKKKLRLTLNVDDIIDKYNYYVPINHIVDDILKNPKDKQIIFKQINASEPREHDIIHEIFRNPNYGILKESYIHINRILKIREKTGGQLILNHPGKYGHIKENFLKKLKEIGFDGIETLSPHHSIGAIMYIQQLARHFDLIETGGSDFHRFEGGKALIQSYNDYFCIDSKNLRGIQKIIKQR